MTARDPRAAAASAAGWPAVPRPREPVDVGRLPQRAAPPADDELKRQTEDACRDLAILHRVLTGLKRLADG